MKSIIVTADDLGLDPYINMGIVDAYQNGIITCSALLMNAPATEEGISIAKNNPGLEVGIHLSIVEGYSLRNVISTITEKKSYFDSGICLKRNWSEFVKCYLMGRIDLNELEEEFELQIRKFKSNFNSIPFLNSTQHMHLLPGIWEIVFKLCKSHGIKYVRLPRLTFPDRLWFNKRMLYLIPFSVLGSYCRLSLKNSGIQSVDYIVGMQFSGSISSVKLKFILSHLGHGVNEIVMHPGFKSQYLINQLHSSYSNFMWEEELEASTSSEIKDFIAKNNIQLLRFSNLKS